MNTHDMRIVLIGAGNLATNLGKAIVRSGMQIKQIYSRTELSASTLAGTLGCDWTVNIEDIVKDADVYIISLKDNALCALAEQFVSGRDHALWVHTAGSIPMDILPSGRRGVLYPMQTFSKSKEVDFAEIPIFIEANNTSDEALLSDFASVLSRSVFHMSSHDRCYLHLAAVFCCNFANHCYAISEQLLKEHGNVPFNVMIPLIEETTRKLHTLTPQEGQTGPAIRWDRDVINKHIEMLSSTPSLQSIYEQMSENIHKFSGLKSD